MSDGFRAAVARSRPPVDERLRLRSETLADDNGKEKKLGGCRNHDPEEC